MGRVEYLYLKNALQEARKGDLIFGCLLFTITSPYTPAGVSSLGQDAGYCISIVIKRQMVKNN